MTIEVGRVASSDRATQASPGAAKASPPSGEYPSRGGWQPIETAPQVEDGTTYLLWSEGCVVATWWDGMGWVDDQEFMRVRASHWMPLPNPPEAA